MGAGTDYTSTESTDAGSIIQVIKLLHPVEFTDSSTGADSVLWNFGDGNTSSERNPIHNYSSNGTFVVTLMAYNEFGEDSTTQTVVVSGIGVDFYEQEVENESIEEVEDELIEEVEDEEVITVDNNTQTFNIDVPSIPEVEEVTFPKDEGNIDYTNEETTTQQTTEEQNKKLEFVFKPFSSDERSMIGMEVKDFLLVEGELERLQIGTPIIIIGIESNKVYNRQVGFVVNDEKNKGIRIDAPIQIEDGFYRVTIEG